MSNVILDDDNDDDGEEFLIEEAPKDPLVSLEAGEEAAVEAGGQEHGALVQQMQHGPEVHVRLIRQGALARPRRRISISHRIGQVQMLQGRTRQLR